MILTVLIVGTLSLPVLPARTRMDHGTETGVMATMHCFLRDQQDDLEDPTDSLLFGPSTKIKQNRTILEKAIGKNGASH